MLFSKLQLLHHNLMDIKRISLHLHEVLIVLILVV